MGMLLHRHNLSVSENITKAEDVTPSVATPVIEEVAEEKAEKPKRGTKKK